VKYLSFVATLSIVLLANAVALLHAARNRSGPPEAGITLTQHELSYWSRVSDQDDSGVSLQLQHSASGEGFWFAVEPWLHRKQLEQLGFKCGVDPTSETAAEYYRRERKRKAYVAFEYNGPGWRSLLEQKKTPDFRKANVSRLVAVDADIDAHKLRARHPDRNSVIILPAVIGISILPSYPAGHLSPRLGGWIDAYPSSIHVPLPFSDQFRRAHWSSAGNPASGPFYRVRLRYGYFFEPQITAVEFTSADPEPIGQ
jgi:hypothetical protein